MKRLFADTFYFLALHNPADQAHARAVSFSRRCQDAMVTTAWVLTEVADALAARPNRVACIRLIESIQSNSRILVVGPDRALFHRGWQLFRERPDKAWSLTDSISFTVMYEMEIEDALTGDQHFEQAGFRVLL